jgi:hypothetical protein
MIVKVCSLGCLLMEELDMRQSPCAVVMGGEYNISVGIQQTTLYQAELQLRNRS